MSVPYIPPTKYKILPSLNVRLSYLDINDTRYVRSEDDYYVSLLLPPTLLKKDGVWIKDDFGEKKGVNDMNELMTVNGVRGRLRVDGLAELSLEDSARGLGFTQTAASGNEVVRWERVTQHLKEFGFIPTSGDGNSQQVGKDTFIPENIFYKLCFKAKNETAIAFQDLVTDEILPTIRKTGSYTAPGVDLQRQRAEAMLLNAKTRNAALWHKLGMMLPESPQHKQICASYASEALTGRKVIALPAVEKTYSATEIGQIYGISAQRVGSIANQNGLKTDEHGMTVMDKSKYSSKEMPTFRYNEKGMREIGRHLLSQ